MTDKSRDEFDAGRLAEAMAPLLGIELAESYRPGVIFHLETARTIMQPVLAVETADDAEPAPVFEA